MDASLTSIQPVRLNGWDYVLAFEEAQVNQGLRMAHAGPYTGPAVLRLPPGEQRVPLDTTAGTELHFVYGCPQLASRAELIEDNALVSALNRGRPGMAAVDVFESEPILQGHPLLRLENAVCTPHIGYVEQDSYEMMFGAAFDNVVNYIRGEPSNIVNPEALKVIR